MFFGIGAQLAAEKNGDGREQQREAEAMGNDCADGVAALGHLREHQYGDGGGRYAAGGETAGDSPVDVTFAAMGDRTAGLGQRCVEQVSADGSRGRDAEQQHQQRRHQRAATNAGQPNDGANGKAGKGIEVIHGRHVNRG